MGREWAEAVEGQPEVALERPLGQLAHPGHPLAELDLEQEAEPGVAAAFVRVVVVAAAAAGVVRAAVVVAVGVAGCAVAGREACAAGGETGHVAAQSAEEAAGLAVVVDEAIAHVLMAAAHQRHCAFYF